MKGNYWEQETKNAYVFAYFHKVRKRTQVTAQKKLKNNKIFIRWMNHKKDDHSATLESG